MPLIEFDETTLAGHATTLGTIADYLRGGTGVVAPPNITVAATQANWSEETDGSALFNITLSHAANGPVTVRGRTVAGTAAQGYDFVGVDELFTIPAGQVQIQVAIGIVNDVAVESDEGFSFVISDAVGGVITQDTANATIQSGDVGDPSPPPPTSTGDVARVGSTTYSTLALAVAAVQSGGLIEILPGTHLTVAKVAAIINKPCTIMGVLGTGGARPVLDLGGDKILKAILNPSFSTGSLTVENIILANAVASQGDPNVFGTMNGSGIRPEPSVPSMTIRNVGFRTCENSILIGTATNMEVYLEDCDIYQCGYQTSVGQAHGIYIGKIKKATFVDCTWTAGRGGQDIKSRALETILDGCVVEQSNSTGSAVEVPNGGILRISGGRYYKPSTGINDKLIRIAAEGTDGRPEIYLIENATLDTQRPSSYVVYNYSSTQCVVRNCTMPSRTTMFGNVKVETVAAPTTEPEPTPAPAPTGPTDVIPAVVSGDVARVGGSTYPTLLAAITAAPAGSVVEILPGRHVGTKAFVGNFSKKLTIRGLLDSQKTRPFLDGSGLNIAKGMLTPNADLTIENVGFMNIHNNDNAAGIWTDPGLSWLIIRWCMFTKNDNGVLTTIGNGLANCLVEDSYFVDNGYGATQKSHNFYGGSGEETKFVRVRSHIPISGMPMKTRMRRCILEDSELIQGSGGNYAVDNPNGGTFIVRNCKLYKPSSNGQQTLIAIGADISNPDNQVPEAGQTRVHYVLIENCILDNLRTPGVIVNNNFDPQVTAIVRNCTMPHATTMLGPVTVE